MPTAEPTDLDRVLGATRELVALVRSRGLTRLAVDAGPVRWEITGAAAALPAGGDGAALTGVLPVAVPVPVEEPPGAAVLAPLVGVFYRSPSPGAPPFVEVGQPVAAGQQVAIVEAMKMMNEVVAETAGVVREVHAADAAIVELGQRLFTIEPVEERR
ncbi:MAG TPA: biotin/lipoyl-containing protein [Mycobacteriales bacterium]|jgi:acetyl-CoA carboxylase biotin carboxyl carrier protein|nr:biotin/lipoyl-containing protein [Mycobacteriales bacterium]